MKIKENKGRPPIDPYFRADSPVKISQYHVDEMAKLGFSKYQVGEFLRKTLNDFIASNGGQPHERQ